MESDTMTKSSGLRRRRRLISLAFSVTAFILSASVSMRAESANVDGPPQAGATVSSVTQVAPGRYRIVGTARDALGNPACALALASGQCVFSCGPGSLRCDGGTGNMPFGQFDLTNLLAEPNGTITLQIFVQGHVSYTEALPTATAAQTP